MATYTGTDPSPSSSSPRYLEFFKVFIPAFSSLQLRVPLDFVKQCKFIPRKVVLREPSGRCWSVGIAENASGLFIKNGWPEFAKDNALQFGDCLLFKYDMSSGFIVKIFGRNGCRKERQGFERPIVVKMEKEEEGGHRRPGRRIIDYSITFDGGRSPKETELQIRP